ncbi:hypothetical protein SAMN02799622_00784 [Methylobacterium sp. UNC378MF]|nr:hypothetical protein SAMN02799622_00784 [Methylobacterium sp. UNC378MF]
MRNEAHASFVRAQRLRKALGKRAAVCVGPVAGQPGGRTPILDMSKMLGNVGLAG